jgi:nitroreductase
MQNWRFVVVRDTELRKQIRAAAIDQAQVTDASLLIVLTATESPPFVVTLTGSHAGNGALLGGQVTFAGHR